MGEYACDKLEWNVKPLDPDWQLWVNEQSGIEAKISPKSLFFWLTDTFAQVPVFRSVRRFFKRAEAQDSQRDTRKDDAVKLLV